MSASTPEFHLYLPQMRLAMDVMVEKARAAEAAGFVGMAGMDHLAPPMAEQHDMYEALTTNAWLLAHTERLVQGQLEGSNVEIVQEMVDMISAQRAYELNSKAVKAADEMSQTATEMIR